jgi:hypothetical protein
MFGVNCFGVLNLEGEKRVKQFRLEAVGCERTGIKILDIMERMRISLLVYGNRFGESIFSQQFLIPCFSPSMYRYKHGLLRSVINYLS